MNEDIKPHAVMLWHEYEAMSIKGWHSVCRDWDGAGNTAFRYGTEGVSDVAKADEALRADHPVWKPAPEFKHAMLVRGETLYYD